MDFGHASHFATRQARIHCGDLYPGPVLMPRGLLRAVDPLLAVGLGPARVGGETFSTSLERTLRGRPDGPLMLALWASVAAGEVKHADLRELLALMPETLPQLPETREQFLGWLRPRAHAMARCVLAVAQRPQPEVMEPAIRLGCGFVLTRLLADLPHLLSRDCIPLPLSDLLAEGCEPEELRAAVRTPAVNRLLAREAAWARSLLDEGLPVCDGVGSRLRRGLRAGVLRARALLGQVADPRHELFRGPTTLGSLRRWSCALRALWQVLPQAPRPEATGAAPAADHGSRA